MRRFGFLLIVIVLFSDFAQGEILDKDSSVIFFPGTRLFPQLFLDPLECQVMGGSYLLFRKDYDLSLYSTVNLGFSEPVISHTGSKYSWEINLGAASFTQFDLIREAGRTYLAGLMNNDYKISVDYTLQKNLNLLKFHIFHISSHLGDDYIQRHSGTLVNDKSVNYEQADLTYLRKINDDFLYAGGGVIYTKYVFRKRLSFQSGGIINFPGILRRNFFAGTDIKLLEENNFSPDIRTAFGINFNRNSESLFKIWIEYYSGRLPYSTIEYGRINWLGMAMKMKII